MQSFIITIKADTIEATGPAGIRVEPQPFTWQPTPELAPTLAQLADENSRVSPEAVQKLGAALYDVLFSREIAVAFSQAQSKVGPKNLRLSLQIEPPHLAVLPWETIYHQADWLAFDSSTPLVRRLTSESGSRINSLEINKPLRILFIGASPKDLPSLDIVGQFRQLQTQLAEPLKKNDITLTGIFNPTQDIIRRQLLKEHHIIYFAGHGTPARSEESFDGTIKQIPAHIAIDDGSNIGGGSGNAYPLTAETLAGMLKGRRNTRLVFLGACNTSTTASQSSADLNLAGDSIMLAGFAQELIERANLPALVAMQYFISDRQAMPLTAHFFAAIAEFVPVDVALAEARRAIVRQGQPMGRDVFAPVIYLQAENATLFKKAWNRAALALAAILAVVVVLASIGGYYQQGETSLERTNRMAAETREAIIQITAEAEAENRAIAESTAQAEATRSAVSNLTRRLANQASLLMDAELDPELSTLLAIEAVRTTKDYDGSYTLQAEEVVRRTVQPRLLATFPHGIPVGRAEFNATGNRIATRTNDGQVHLWDVTNRQELVTLPYYRYKSEGWGYDWVVIFNKDGSRLMTFAHDELNLVDTADGTIITTIETAPDTARQSGLQPRFTPDGNYLMLPQTDFVPVLLDATDGTRKFELRDSQPITHVVFSPDSQWIATAGSDGVKLWDMDTGQITDILVKEATVTNFSPHITFSPDSKYLAVVSEYKEFTSSGQAIETGRIWNVDSKKTLVVQFKPPNDNRTLGDIFFYPDSNRFYSSGGFGGVPYLWDTQTGEPVISLPDERYDDHIYLDSTGNRAVNGGLYRTILYNGYTGEEIVSWDRTAGFWGFNSTNTRLMIDFFNYNVRYNDILLVDSQTGNDISHLSSDNELVHNAEFSPDGKYVATAHADGKAQLWDSFDGSLLAIFPHSDEVYKVDFSPDGQQLLAASEDGTARLWGVDSPQEPLTLVQPRYHSTYDVRDVIFSPNNETILTTYGGNTVALWSVLQSRLVYTWFHHFISPNHFSPDGNLIADYETIQSFTHYIYTPQIRLVDTNTGKEKLLIDGEDIEKGGYDNPDRMKTFQKNGRPSTRMTSYGNYEVLLENAVFSNNGNLLAEVSSGNTVEVWDVETQQIVSTLENDAEAIAATFSHDDKHLFIGKASEKGTTLWDIETEQKIADFPEEATVERIILSPDGNYFVTTSFMYGGFGLWHIPTQKKIRQFYQARIAKVVFSPDSQFLVTALGVGPIYQDVIGNTIREPEGNIYLKRTETGEDISVIHSDEGVREVTFTPDSQYLLVAVKEGYVEIVDTETGETVDFLDHESPLYDLALHPDGNRVATVTGDGMIRVWDLARREVVSVMSHGAPLRAVAFSHDGKRLASAGIDGTAKVWRVEMDDLLALACRKLSRNLTQDEWKQYMGNLSYRKTCVDLQ